MHTPYNKVSDCKNSLNGCRYTWKYHNALANLTKKLEYSMNKQLDQQMQFTPTIIDGLRLNIVIEK